VRRQSASDLDNEPREQPSGQRLATYVVRISRDASSRIIGVVVRVATGEQFAFASVDDMAEILRERLRVDSAEPG
jgi:hypothetical protein